MYKNYAMGMLRDVTGDGTQGGGGTGDGTATPPAFDPAAFETKLTGTLSNFQKTLNTFDKTIKEQNKTIVSLQEQLKTQSTTESAEGVTGDSKNKPDPVLNGRLQKAERDLAALNQKLLDAEKATQEATAKQREVQRVSSIKDLMNAFEFRDEAARKTAFKALQSDIVYDEDGNLVANSDSGPIAPDQYVKSYLEALPGLLAPKGGGGAGARTGSGKVNGFDPLNPANVQNYGNLKPEEQALVKKAVFALGLPTQQT